MVNFHSSPHFQDKESDAEGGPGGAWRTGTVVSQLPKGTWGSTSVLQGGGQKDTGTAEGAGMGLRWEAMVVER